MAWDDEITEIVRISIGDLADTPSYCDDRIRRTILVVAQQLINEFAFCTTYSINIVSGTITPDPTTPTRDEAFIYLVGLKAGALIVNGELRKFALNGVKVTDGPSSVDMGNVFTNLNKLASDLNTKYDKALMLFRLYGCDGPSGQGYGQAIFGPTTKETILPERFI